MNVKQDNQGLTLIEVMIASLIILILFLALMQSVLLSVSMNLKNQLRDEAVNIAEERMRELRSMDFDDADIATAGTFDDGTAERFFRNIPQPRVFSRIRIIGPQGTDMKSITVTVSYMDVKDNRCSVTSSTECASDDDCPEGETCGAVQTISSILRKED